MKRIILGIFLINSFNLFAQTPVVENVWFEQRTDGSLLVDIYYDVTSISSLPLEIIVEASGDNGTTWDLPCNSLTGDVGEDIIAGIDKHVVWDFYADNPDKSGSNYQVRVIAHCMVCGQTIVEDFTFTRDIECPDTVTPAINIGFPDITLDLGGFTLTGDLSHGFHEGIIADHTEGLTIQNGTIKGFINSIILGSSDNSTVKNMNIINLQTDDNEQHASGVIIGKSKGIVIRDCWFEYLPAAHKQAVNAANSEILVDNIQMNGGSIGVGIGGLIDPGNAPSRGSIINSRFYGPVIGGAFIGYVDSLYVANNEFDNSLISVVPPKNGNVTGVIIEENTIKNFPGYGIYLRGGKELIISNNNITNCGKGIVLESSTGCGSDSILEDQDCNYPVGNLITNNTVVGNTQDLFHCEKCLGNTWQNNTYETAEGIEIYKYPPVTASTLFSSIDSLATTNVSDAQLIFVGSWSCDTIGISHKWVYLYQSLSQQKKYEYWVNDSKVVVRDSISLPWMVNGEFIPTTEPWIDSDSAMVIAEGMGGKEFRESFQLITIEMALQNLNWNIHYIAQDTIFSTNIDAKME